MTRSHDKLVYRIGFIYLAFISIYLLWHGAWFSPDQFFIMALLVALLMGRSREFIRDWLPVIMFYLGYETLRSLVPLLKLKVNIYPMINFDQSLFGYIPTVKLQQLLFNPHTIHWYDYFAMVMYTSHFVVPLLVAYILWLKSKRLFKEYTVAWLIISYAAFITYILFPAMPPWMASGLGIIPPVNDIMGFVGSKFASPLALPSVYHFFSANDVAAVPSLHAAYPFLIFLFSVKRFGWVGWFTLPYSLGVWFAVVYLAQHYVADVILGVLYVVIIYIPLSYFLFRPKKRNVNLSPVPSIPVDDVVPVPVED